MEEKNTDLDSAIRAVALVFNQTKENIRRLFLTLQQQKQREEDFLRIMEALKEKAFYREEDEWKKDDSLLILQKNQFKEKLDKKRIYFAPLRRKKLEEKRFPKKDRNFKYLRENGEK